MNVIINKQLTEKEQKILNKAMNDYPNAESNYEALGNYAKSVRKKLYSFRENDPEFILLRNLYIEIKSLQDSIPIKYNTKMVS